MERSAPLSEPFGLRLRSVVWPLSAGRGSIRGPMAASMKACHAVERRPQRFTTESWDAPNSSLLSNWPPTYVRVQVGKGGQHHLAAQVYLPRPRVLRCVAGRVQRCHNTVTHLQLHATAR